MDYEKPRDLFGTCELCEESILKGDLYYDFDDGYVCEECIANYNMKYRKEAN